VRAESARRIGTSFHVVAGQAMTLRGLAAGVARWFCREPVLDFVDWAEFERRVEPEHAEITRQHTVRSITPAREVLGYAPGTACSMPARGAMPCARR
jgi:hypothetical protein